MAMQLPTLNRAPVQEQASTGRIDMKPLDVERPMAQVAASANKLVEAGGTYVEREMAFSADTTATAAASSYHQSLEDRFAGKDGVKYVKGDPTEAYTKFDEDSKKMRAQILADNESASDFTKAQITAHLDNVEAKFRDKKVTTYGSQLNNYRTTVSNDAVKLSQDNMLDATAHLDVNDPNTLVPIEKEIGDITDRRTKQFLQDGRAKPIMENGKVVGYDYDPSATLQMNKDVSDGLKSAIQNLIATGDVDGAKFMTDKYQSQLDRAARPKIEEQTEKAFTKQSGDKLFQSVANLPVDQAMEKMKSEKDPGVQERAMKRYDSYTRYIKNNEARGEKMAYDEVGKIILDRQKAGQPFTDATDMLDDPRVKRIMDTERIKDPKKMVALQHMVEQPKDSDVTKKGEYYDTLFSGKLQGMNYGDFNELVSGLNKQDRAQAETQYRKFNSQTPGEENRMIVNMGSSLAKQMQQAEVVKKNAFGKYDDATQRKITTWNNEMVQAIGTMPPGMSKKDQDAYVIKFVADKKKEQVFTPPDRPKFQGKIAPPPPADTKPSQNTVASVPGVQAPANESELRKAAIKNWMKENPGKTLDFSSKDTPDAIDIFKRVETMKRAK